MEYLSVYCPFDIAKDTILKLKQCQDKCEELKINANHLTYYL